MKKLFKKGAVKFLKLFTTIDEIPFTDNGKSKVHATLFIFGVRVASSVYPSKSISDVHFN